MDRHPHQGALFKFPFIDRRYRSAYEKAVKNFSKLPVENERIFKPEAIAFTNRLAEQMEVHEIKEKTASVTGETIVAGW